jgi:PhnB protein
VTRRDHEQSGISVAPFDLPCTMTTIQPQLWIEQAGAAVSFYQRAFGARVLHSVGVGDDIVAQLGVGEASFWVSRADPP